MRPGKLIPALLLTVAATLIAPMGAWGQVVFTDNFTFLTGSTQTDTFTSGTNSANVTYNTVHAGFVGNVFNQTNAGNHPAPSGDQYLRLGSGSATSPGRTSISTTVSALSSLSASSDTVAWSFSTHTTVTDLTGVAATAAPGQVGYAVVLAGTSGDFTTGNGYALVNDGNLRLVTYSGGLTGTLTDIVASTGNTFDASKALDLRVSYNPANDAWTLSVADQGNNTSTSTWGNTGTAFTTVGTATLDASLTGTNKFGYYWNFQGDTGGISGQQAHFDNVLIVTPEPAALFGLAACGLLIINRRRILARLTGTSTAA